MSESFARLGAEITAHNRAIVMRETFGHLDTPPGTNPGYITFVLGCHGDITLLDWQFKDVSANPWIYQELHEFIGDFCLKERNKDRAFGVWHFEGYYKRFKNGTAKFIGKTRPCRVSLRFGDRKTVA